MPQATLDIPLGATHREDEVHAIFGQGGEAVVFALLNSDGDGPRAKVAPPLHSTTCCLT
ncbi:MAG: hypothetical protein HY706_05875 [Candidatus Hydrogenedentes bacterium]|nr:hypothetical protein [Candidatus Hydrogenedentota bacterium]